MQRLYVLQVAARRGAESIAVEKLCLSIGHDGVGIPAASGSTIAIALATSNACVGVGLKDRWIDGVADSATTAT